MPKKVTTEALARMMAKGFEAMASKADLMAVKQDLEKTIKEEASSIRHDLENLELRMGHLAYAFEVKDLKRRMAVVERKISAR